MTSGAEQHQHIHPSDLSNSDQQQNPNPWTPPDQQWLSQQQQQQLPQQRVIDTTSADSVQEARLNAAAQFVDRLNTLADGKWLAQLNARFALMEDAHRKRIGGGVRALLGRDALPPGEDATRLQPDDELADEASSGKPPPPRAFDARQAWPGCADTIGTVQDQSNCASCWAVSSASAYTDRYCITRAASGANTSASVAANQFSALDTLSCAPHTGGCDGGWPLDAWIWMKKIGVRSGTDYTVNSGCKPYPFAPKSTAEYSTPACAGTCTHAVWHGFEQYKGYGRFIAAGSSPENSKYYNSPRNAWIVSWVGYYWNDIAPFTSLNTTVRAMEKEILVNGTVVAVMDVYDDFFCYKSGVYEHISTSYLGAHAVRLIGWGTHTHKKGGTKQDYWLGINSWNTDWGQRGFFKIAKGTNECRIESSLITFGTPSGIFRADDAKHQNEIVHNVIN